MNKRWRKTEGWKQTVTRKSVTGRYGSEERYTFSSHVVVERSRWARVNEDLERGRSEVRDCARREGDLSKHMQECRTGAASGFTWNKTTNEKDEIKTVVAETVFEIKSACSGRLGCDARTTRSVKYRDRKRDHSTSLLKLSRSPDGSRRGPRTLGSSAPKNFDLGVHLYTCSRRLLNCFSGEPRIIFGFCSRWQRFFFFVVFFFFFVTETTEKGSCTRFSVWLTTEDVEEEELEAVTDRVVRHSVTAQSPSVLILNTDPMLRSGRNGQNDYMNFRKIESRSIWRKKKT